MKPVRKPQFSKISAQTGDPVPTIKKRLGILLCDHENSRHRHHGSFNAYQDQFGQPRNYYITRFASGFTSSGEQQTTIGNLPREARFDSGLTYHLRHTSQWNDLARHVAKHYTGGRYQTGSGRSESFNAVFAWERELWEDIFDLFLVTCLGALAQLLYASQQGKRADLTRLYTGIQSELSKLMERANNAEISGELKYSLVPRLTILLASFLLELRGFGQPTAHQLLEEIFSFYLHCPRDQLQQLTLAIEINPAYLSKVQTGAGRTINSHQQAPRIAVHLGRTSHLPLHSEEEARRNQCFGLRLEQSAFATAYLSKKDMKGEWQTVNLQTKGSRKGFICKINFVQLAHLRAGLPYSP